MEGKPEIQDETENINEKFKTIDLGSKFQPKKKKPTEPDQKGPIFYHYLLNDFNAMKYYQTDVLAQPFKKLEHYKDISKIKCAFPSTLKMNDPNFEPRKLKNAKFFILRSTCDDDIHKAIKYGFWTSTYKNNVLLNDLFKKYSRSGTPVYLIYTVVGSGQYCGLAQMSSEVELKKTFSYWWEEVKWSGVFRVNWIYVKDLLYDEVEDIRLRNGNKVVSSKDGTELDFETGMEMLKRFKNSIYVSDIFEYFEFMDNREEKIRLKRDSMNQIIGKLKSKGLIPDMPPKSQRRKGKKNSDRRRPKGERGGQFRNFPQQMQRNQFNYQQQRGKMGPMPGMYPGMMAPRGMQGRPMYPGFMYNPMYQQGMGYFPNQRYAYKGGNQGFPGYTGPEEKKK